MNNGIKTILLLFMVLWGMCAHSQNVAVKSNLLYDVAAYTLNAGVEAGLAPRWKIGRAHV